MLKYATPAEVTHTIHSHTPEQDIPEPGVMDRIIGISSMLIRHATRSARYTTLPSGLPADDDVADAMRDATIAHCHALIAAALTADDINTGGAAGPTVTATSAKGASITLEKSQGDVTREMLRAGHLCHEAQMILRDARLTNRQPGVVW